jgi:hypothetical protein
MQCIRLQKEEDVAKDPKLFTAVNAKLDDEDLEQFTRDLASLGATSEEIRQTMIDVLNESMEPKIDIADVSLALYNDIKDFGKRLQKMLKQPYHERPEPLTDEQLNQLIRSNRKMEREACKYV